MLPASSMNDMTANVALMIMNGSAKDFNERFEKSDQVGIRRRADVFVGAVLIEEGKTRNRHEASFLPITLWLACAGHSQSAAQLHLVP
jgi:hypothetical protein